MEKTGFIGLGIMGRPMTLHLLKAGYTLSVLEKNKASKELVAAGARSFATPAAIAQNSDVVITMLPDSPEVITIVSGQDGLLEGIPQGALFIDMSTIAPATSKNIYDWLQKEGVE